MHVARSLTKVSCLQDLIDSYVGCVFDIYIPANTQTLGQTLAQRHSIHWGKVAV